MLSLRSLDSAGPSHVHKASYIPSVNEGLFAYESRNHDRSVFSKRMRISSLGILIAVVPFSSKGPANVR